MKYRYENTLDKNTYELKQVVLEDNEKLSLIEVFKNDISIGMVSFAEIADSAENKKAL